MSTRPEHLDEMEKLRLKLADREKRIHLIQGSIASAADGYLGLCHAINEIRVWANLKKRLPTTQRKGRKA